MRTERCKRVRTGGQALLVHLFNDETTNKNPAAMFSHLGVTLKSRAPRRLELPTAMLHDLPPFHPLKFTHSISFYMHVSK